MNYVHVANDGDFDVVSLDEIMTKIFLVIFLLNLFTHIHLYIIYKYVEFGGYRPTSLEIIYWPKLLWAKLNCNASFLTWAIFVIGRNALEP